MKIAVDLDDTLSRPERAEIAGEYIRRNGLPFNLIDPHSRALKGLYDWGDGDVTRFMKEGGGLIIFTEAPARRGAKEVLSAWRKEGHKVTILTGRFKEWFSNPERVSRDWLEKRHIPYDEIVAEVSFRDKGNYCREHGIGILVDDNIEACLGAQRAGIPAVLAVGRHNVARAGEIAYAGGTWKQIDEVVRKILTGRG